jgi:4-amino-4-deoxy-L-arabinose transferase-like glycosyltransferase
MALLDFLIQRFKARPLVCIIVLNLALMCSGNWILPLIDRDEPRFAEATREMVARHDWVVPWFNGSHRYDKPPLIYWLQAGCYALLGENEFAARLPSCLFTTAIAVMLYFWGRSMGREETGILAAMIFTTCLEVLAYGRLAFADIPMIFFFTLAVWSGWEAASRRGAQELKWWIVFGASLGLGFLAKGPVAWLPLAGVILMRCLKSSEFFLPVSKLMLSLALALGIVAAWGIPAIIATHGEFLSVGLGHHVITRSIYVFEGHGQNGFIGWLITFPFFFLTFFIGFAPWSFWVAKCLKRGSNPAPPDAFRFYLMLQVLIVFVVFTLVHTKLPHYTLPAFPCLALWLAHRAGMDAGLHRKVYAAGLAMGVLTILTTTIGFTFVRPYFAGKTLFEQARPLLTSDMRLAVVGYDEPGIVWEFRSVLTNYCQSLPQERVVEFLAQPGPKILIYPSGSCLSKAVQLPPNASLIQSDGLNVAHGKHVDLTAVIER